MFNGYKYMNIEIQLFAISKKEKTKYKQGVVHKIYESKRNKDFYTNKINLK